MTDTIFLTGGTGFLGTEIADQLVLHTDKPIYVLVRARDEAQGHGQPAHSDHHGPGHADLGSAQGAVKTA